MSDAPQQPAAPAPDPSSRANKRTPAQKDADLLFIEKYSIRGKTLRQIADLLAKDRPYKLSHAQIGADLKKLRMRWKTEALEMVGHEKTKELKKLDILEAEAWDAWERSKQVTTRTTFTKKSGKRSAGVAADMADGETKTAVQTSTPGDAAFLGKIFDAHDRRVALLGLAAPKKSELSGPDGGPIMTANANVPLTEDSQNALLRRHFARMVEDEAKPVPEQPKSDDPNGSAATATPDSA